jgi:glutamine synthetase
MEFLRILWCDVSGIRRCRIVPLLNNTPLKSSSRVVKLNRDDGHVFITGDIRLVLSAVFLPCFGDLSVVGHGYAEDVGIDIVPCPVIPLPFSVDCITVSRLSDISRAPWSGKYRQNHPWCPRQMLERSIARLRCCFDLTLQVGFETEFILLRRVVDRDGNETYTPLEKSVYCQSSSFDRVSSILRDMCDALTEAGQRVLHVHGESADGQFEIVTGHGDVLAQADEFLIRKELIQHVAGKHGLYASFLPKYFDNQAGSASHVHFSFTQRDNDNSSADQQYTHMSQIPVSKTMQAFMSGIIENMGGLLMLTAGSPNSTRRITPGAWAGAYACWGLRNKETPLRMIDTNDDHVEYKAFDGTANPYLGLCGLICAGMDGLTRQLALPPAVQVDPASLPSDECTRLPKSFEETVLYFQESLGAGDKGYGMIHEWYQSCCHGTHDTGYEEISRGTLSEFFHNYMAVKFSELERFKNTSFEEEVSILFDKY